MADLVYTPEQAAALLEALMERQQKHNPGSSTLTAQAMHGPNQGNEAQFGLFSAPGRRPGRLSALVRPPSDLFRALTLERSIFYDELIEVVTDQTAASGTNASGWCDTPVGAGQLLKVAQAHRWGKLFVKTDLEAVPEVGQLRNRADVPAEILNAGPANNPLIPDLMYRMDNALSALQSEFFRLGVQIERTLDTVMIQGDPTLAYTSTHWGWIKEFKGLDQQIKTGYTDPDTGSLIPALDSIVASFNAAVDGTDSNGDNILSVFTDVYYAVRSRAQRSGITGIVLGWVMREEFHRALAQVWACSYMIYKCNVANAGINQFATETRALYDAMIKGRYLLIDGDEVPVLYSEGIPQDSLGNNQFKSDSYLVPFNSDVLPLLRPEFFPMDNAQLKEYAAFVGADDFTTLNNGLYLAGTQQVGLCKNYLFAGKLRLILEAPWLAARVDDIRYTFRAQIRNAQPGDTWFHKTGGVSYVP